MERRYAHSVSGGAGGYGTRVADVRQVVSMTHAGGKGQVVGMSQAGFVRPVVGMTRVADISMEAMLKAQVRDPEYLIMGNEKTIMQHLNDRLATYLEEVRNLEQANHKLEIKIRQAIEKRGPLEGKNYSKYEDIIADLKKKIFDVTKGNAHLGIAIDNARLAADDFKVKMEYELSMRQSVEADVAGLRKILDDTNVIRMHLESDIESLKEELITLKKNHQMDVAELHAQITQAGVNVDVDAAKGQDLARIMEEMREKYEKIILKNQDNLKTWHDSQIMPVQVQVDANTTALKEATTKMTEKRRSNQVLEIELQSLHSMKASLEATLRDLEMRYNLEVKKYNAVILRLQDELTKIRGEIQQQSREYEHLLNIKMKLEAEITEYRRLLDCENFQLEDAIEPRIHQTKVVTFTQTLVDGQVVSESKDVKSIDD